MIELCDERRMVGVTMANSQRYGFENSWRSERRLAILLEVQRTFIGPQNVKQFGISSFKN